MVTKEEDCLPPVTETTSRCYSTSSSTPLAELETVRSLEIVESSSSLSPVWYIVFFTYSFNFLCLFAIEFFLLLTIRGKTMQNGKFGIPKTGI
jgi:hypothetical protein